MRHIIGLITVFFSVLVLSSCTKVPEKLKEQDNNIDKASIADSVILKFEDLPQAEKIKISRIKVFGTDNKKASLRINNRDVFFPSSELVYVGNTPVLVSGGSLDFDESSHAESGAVVVHYLNGNDQGGVDITKSFVPFIEIGSWGQLGEMSVGNNLTNNPVVYVEGGGTWQGVTCGWASLGELTPEKPIEIATIIRYGEIGQGKITNIIKDRSFDVVYKEEMGDGESTRRYVRRGDRYIVTEINLPDPNCELDN